MIAQVPELWDGGYWYVVAVVTDPETESLVPDVPAGTAWAQWYNDGTRSVIKTPAQIVVPYMGVAPSDLIQIPRKPRARFQANG
jgi:hypothetical protein